LVIVVFGSFSFARSLQVVVDAGAAALATDSLAPDRSHAVTTAKASGRTHAATFI
jgi:hypothetical protein